MAQQKLHPVFQEVLRKTGFPFPGVNYLTHIDNKRQIAYLETPKVACTSIKKFMMDQYVGGTFSLKRPGMVHDRIRSPLKQFSDLHPRHALPVLMGSEYKRFSFVRNPYSRVLSGYLDKLVTNEYERARHLPMMGFEPDSHPTLLEFLERLVTKDEITVDIHFMSQAALLMVEHVEYDYIGRFERFEQDFLRLQATYFGVDHPTQSYEGFGKHHASNANDKIMEYFGAREVELVQQFYARDFDLFGYDPDPAHASDEEPPIDVTTLKEAAYRADNLPAFADRVVEAAQVDEAAAVEAYKDLSEALDPAKKLALCDILARRLDGIAWFAGAAARLEQKQGYPHLASIRWSDVSERYPDSPLWQLELPFSLVRTGRAERALTTLKATKKPVFSAPWFKRKYVERAFQMVSNLPAEQMDFGLNFLETLARKLSYKTFLEELKTLSEAKGDVVDKASAAVTGYLSGAQSVEDWPFVSVLFGGAEEDRIPALDAQYLDAQDDAEVLDMIRARA